MTSPTTSGLKLSRKNCRKCCFRWLQVEFLENGLREDHQISHLLGAIGLSNLPDMTSLEFGHCLLNRESTNFSWALMPTYSNAVPDMTLPASSPVGIYWCLKKNDRKCRLQWLWVKFFRNILSKDHEIVHTYRGQSALYTKRIWHD